MGLLKAFGLAHEYPQLSIGARATQLSAIDDQGNKIELDEVFPKGITLVYFFPKALTPVCTSQACEFRDHFKTLQEKEIRVMGVSRDRPETLRRFKEKHQLNFTILSDVDGRLCKAFGVPIIFSVSLRQSFLIRDGILVWRDLHPKPGSQVESILAAMEKFKAATTQKE